MKTRDRWLREIERLWRQKSIIWLSGVRRIGKTSLCRMVPGVEYFNCELPSVQRQLEDIEFFLSQREKGARLALDEIHRMEDPTRLLKVAADEFPDVKILATGSSTLAATGKFRDSLTDRKRSLFLPPVLWSETREAFGLPDLDRRLLRGGFPERLLAQQPLEGFFEDWMESMFARDIQELFGVRNRSGFLALLKLVCLRSGGQLDVTDLSKECRMSRPTVTAHLDALELSHVVHRLPPFHGGGHREIIRQPKIYAFDTGLVSHVRGWEEIRETDRGRLWEMLVLDELKAALPYRKIFYWRDKSRREIDFIVEGRGGEVHALETKINPDTVRSDAFRVFRSMYPAGKNVVVSPGIGKPHRFKLGDLVFESMNTNDLASLGD
jgi:predicted AAA+ superfamily ATPase